ncbi:hypothetical protein [Roseitalea porphyridii]|uniref:Uncharacterized protein n=1 Tax=Roseitalea porphyridii TaxID=1852022 RepID=A0A4P6UZB8_9HYPH|nr:hypothetical protein [Roseitalea porphyridii]QBK30392.1 hypothetical protein E0E05_07140 [Roseitalea porphyridii]
MRFRTIVSAMAIGVAAAPVVALAQSADPAWLDTVSEQLARDEQCLVEYYVNIREGELAGRKTYEARAQCRDGRQFDAVRTEPEAQFTVRLCEVQVC